MTNNWDESEHTRDDIGRFTYKNGGASSSTGIIEGGVQKTDYPDDWGGGDSEGGGIGDTIGDILTGVLGVVLNPQTISAVLNILAMRYSVKEMKKIKDELYEYMEKHSNSEQKSQELQNAKLEKFKQELLAQQEERERKLQNRLDILYGSDEEYYKKFPHRNYPQFDGSMTGGATNIDSNNFKNKIEYEKYKLAIDNIGLKPARNEARKQYGLETAENLYMSKSDSYMNTEYAKQHLVLDNYEKLSGDLKNYFADKITKQLHLSEVSEQQRQYVLDNTKGIYIEPNSESSKKLAEVLLNEPDFIETVKNNKNNILKGKIAEGSIEFKNKNFHYAIGRADIKNIKLNSNGDMTLLVTDVYDFNKDSDSPLIQAGRKRQKEGKIKPYFIIYDVVIPKEYL